MINIILYLFIYLSIYQLTKHLWSACRITYYLIKNSRCIVTALWSNGPGSEVRDTEIGNSARSTTARGLGKGHSLVFTSHTRERADSSN